MAEEEKEQKPADEKSKGGNGVGWNMQTALQNKTICNNCKSAEGPFGLIVNTGKPMGGGIPAVGVIICGCFESSKFGCVLGMGCSCEEFLARPVSQIAIARMANPGISLSGLKGVIPSA